MVTVVGVVRVMFIVMMSTIVVAATLTVRISADVTDKMKR